MTAAGARDFFAAAELLSTSGVHVILPGTAGNERIRAACGANCARLVEIKRRYDPGNFFCVNRNIAPSR